MNFTFKQRAVLGLCLVILVAVGATAYTQLIINKRNSDQVVDIQPRTVVCTKEAQVCPDGSTVGRVGARCEFADCPRREVPAPSPIKPSPLPATTAALKETIQISGVTITPLEVLEDSRCLVDVQCIQAGTVRLLVLVAATAEPAQRVSLTLQKPFLFGNKEITLVSVQPNVVSTQLTGERMYVFNFAVKATN